ncbi:hypothetical protein HY480_02955 [Candidatus Uhrbacteria bacterium]|nr:hypothetical protein [Candidatus Uhrbacteria bacterium]
MIGQRVRFMGLLFWGMIGLVGIGIGAGMLWVERASTYAVAAPPVIRFLPAANPEHGASRTITSMDALIRSMDSAPERDLDTFLDRSVRAMDAPERDAFLRMLRDATMRGDRFARRALTGIARVACGTLTAISGGTADADDHARCANDLTGAVGHPAERQSTERVARLAELAALLDAGIATPYVIGAFCATATDTTNIPPVFAETVARLTAAHCAIAVPTSDVP